MLKFAVFLLLAVAFAGDTKVFSPRVGANGPPAALVFLQGAQIPYTGYAGLFSQIQKATNLTLWITIPGFALDVPDPLTVGASVTDSIALMHSSGLPSEAPIFLAGHSLGGIVAQDFLFKSPSVASGLILYGSFLQRKYYYPLHYPVPTLTIGGELDGLSRVTRMAEAYYHQITLAQQDKTFPVAVLNGVNHWQFAGVGNVPLLVHERDLMPECDQNTAWAQMALLTTNFMSSGSSGSVAVSNAVDATAVLVGPIVSAFELEGSRHFNAPAQVDGAKGGSCVKGGCPDSSQWSTQAQLIIGADIPGFSVSATNFYVDLGATPLTGEEFHLPKVTRVDKTLSVVTYAQGAWDLLDPVDSGFGSVSANELGVKLYSRQCLLINGAGYPNTTSFDVDSPDFCAQTNKLAYQTALSSASPATRARFTAYGQPYTFGPDYAINTGGFVWVKSRLQYNSAADGSVQIVSPIQKTEIDYWARHFPFARPSAVPDPGCYHYCKLLSPARAIEWIYVDSLRKKRHL